MRIPKIGAEIQSSPVQRTFRKQITFYANQDPDTVRKITDGLEKTKTIRKPRVKLSGNDSLTVSLLVDAKSWESAESVAHKALADALGSVGTDIDDTESLGMSSELALA